MRLFRPRWEVRETRADRRLNLATTTIIARRWTRRGAALAAAGYVRIMSRHNASGIGPRLRYTIGRAA